MNKKQNGMNSMKRPRVVWIPTGAATKLSKAFGCTPKAVSEAINGKSDSELSRRIRHTAIKGYGGVAVKYYETSQAVQCETSFDAAGNMTQDYGNGVVLIASRVISRVSVLVDGDVKITSDNATDEEFALLQKQAQMAAESRSI